MASHYCFKIRQENDDRLEQLCSEISDDLFNIRLVFRCISSLNPETVIETFVQSVVCTRDEFLLEEYDGSIVLSMLADTGAAPEFLESVIVPRILSFAREIVSEPVNLERKVIKLIVEVVVDVSINDEIDEVVDESMNKLNFKPASRSSIQDLRRFKWDDEDHIPIKKRRKLQEGLRSKKECSICLEEFLDGDEVASIPCSHVYHDGCIVKWLKTSHLCPLCRFQMPY